MDEERTLYQKIDDFCVDLPPDSRTRRALHAAAGRMEKAGWPNGLILRLLYDIFSAAMYEYNDWCVEPPSDKDLEGY